MKPLVRIPLFGARVVAARLHQRVGSPGLLGLSLLLTASVMLPLTQHEHQRRAVPRPTANVPVSDLMAMAMTADPAKAGIRQVALPLVSGIPLLLTRIQRTALDQGLGWPKADYRFNPATDEMPASIEVHCGLKGPYPAIRRFVTALLQEAPTLTLREFSLSRSGADVADIEAKLSIVVYLASAPTMRAEAAP